MSNDLLIDKRIIERNIKRGRLDAAEYQGMLDALPDLRGQLWQRPEPRPEPRAPEPAAPPAVAPAAPAPVHATPPVHAYAPPPSAPAVDEPDEEPEEPESAEPQPSPFA